MGYVRKYIATESPSYAHAKHKYNQYLNNMFSASPEERKNMIKIIKYAE